MKLIVIGHGMVGHKFLESLAEAGSQDIEVTVPVRVCPTCDPNLSVPEAIRAALRTTPEYAAVLDRYPQARITRRV